MQVRALLAGLLLGILMVPVLASPAWSSGAIGILSEAPPSGGRPPADGFPLLGWWSLAAVVVLGLLPVGLWLWYSRTSRTT